MDPEEVIKVAIKELDVHSNSQAAIHYIPSDDPKQAKDKKETEYIEDLFMPEESGRISWHSSPQLARFRCPFSQGGVTYNIDYSYSRVYSFYLSMTLPEVSVVKDYEGVCRVAWSPNVGPNLAGRSRVVYGRTIAEDYPVYADDVERQFNCGKSGQQEIQMRNSGNTPLLTQWSISKPQFGPLYVTPIFHFTRDLAHCIRPNILDDKSQVSVSFDPRAYKDVLRMQVYQEGKWISIPCDLRLVNFKEQTKGESRENPLAFVATGDVVIVDADQKAKEINCHNTFVNHIKTYKVQEKAGIHFGEVAEFDLKDQKSICVAMCILAFNERAPTFGCYSNYTTNPENPEEGVDPIKNCKIYYGQTLAKIYDAYHMSYIESRKCPSMPVEIGYHIISFCHTDPFSTSPHALSGIVPALEEMKVQVALNQYSPGMVEATKDDKFRVVLLMFTVQKLIYNKVENGLTPAFSIAISE